MQSAGVEAGSVGRPFRAIHNRDEATFSNASKSLYMELFIVLMDSYL